MRILVGVDAELAGVEWLVDRAGAYAARLGGVVDLGHFSSEDGQRARLAALAERLASDQRGQYHSDLRDPVAGLVEASERYDLLVLGAREMGVWERLVHGSSTARVLSHSRCPVLVPHAREPLDAHPRILVGVDLESPLPAHVLGWAERFASALGAKVDGVSAVATHDGDWFAHRARLQSAVETLAGHVDASRRGSFEVRRGVPQDVLTTASADYDLLVVGNREREGLAQVVFGSVAAAMIRRASCDVLVVPTVTGLPG